MTATLFVGPSLPDAAQLLRPGDHIELRPPVAAGDLLRLPLGPGDLVGIVDGYFHQTRAVRHKEILALLDRGVRVFGAASMGALRAAELDTFGMVGVGRIYQQYRDGRLTADDEVALAHAPEEAGYRPASIPLANLRAILDQAVTAGAADPARASSLIRQLAQIPYPDRTFTRLLTLAKEERPADDQLQAFLVSCTHDQKRADALELLDRLRRPADRETGKAWTLSRSVFLHGWDVATAGSDRDRAGGVSDLALLRICQLFAPDYPVRHRQLVVDRLVAECAANCPDGVGTDPESAAVAHGVHRGVYSADDLGFMTDWTTPAERIDLSEREQLLRFLARSYRITPGIIDDRSGIDRARPFFEHARAIARTASAVNAEAAHRLPEFSLDALRPDRLTDWAARTWQVPLNELPLAVLDRGFDSVATFIASLRPYYLLARYNPDHLRIPAIAG